MSKEDFIKYRSLARIAKETHIDQFFKQRNIVGMAFGRKIVHGEFTDEPAAVVYVMKKVKKRFLSPSRTLPEKIYIGGDCINVDVVETGPFLPLAFTNRERPAPSGISVGNINEASAGTLGCLVRDLSDGSLCILSNNHVLARQNAAALGEGIVQPGVYDGGVGSDQIATLKRFQMINASGNTIDAAIAQVTTSADVVDQMKDNLMPVPNVDHPAVGLLFAGGCNRTIMNPINDVLAALNIQFLSGANATAGADFDMNVEKVGRTTEYTTSTIVEVDATVSISYDFGTATFDHQITTMWMSDSGDSGSVICRGGEGGQVDNCNCGSSEAAGNILQREIKVDLAVEKVFREKYLSNTRTGRYLLDTFFANEDNILKRVQGVERNKEDVGYLQYLYEKYIEVARNVGLNPTKSRETLTGKHLDEAKQALGRFSEYLDEEEKNAAYQLFEMAQSLEGQTAGEILETLDTSKFYNEVVKIISRVSSLKKNDCQ